MDQIHSLEESGVSFASRGSGEEDGCFLVGTARGRFVASLVVTADVAQKRILNSTLSGVTVDTTGGDVRDVGVRGVEAVGGLSDAVFPSISLRAASAVGDSG